MIFSHTRHQRNMVDYGQANIADQWWARDRFQFHGMCLCVWNDPCLKLVAARSIDRLQFIFPFVLLWCRRVFVIWQRTYNNTCTDTHTHTHMHNSHKRPQKMCFMSINRALDLFAFVRPFSTVLILFVCIFFLIFRANIPQDGQWQYQISFFLPYTHKRIRFIRIIYWFVAERA